ncbi:hypothetical protein C7974DRAFT_452559 [Boeremia exigua]|uniref:uncharacterized protein n=1 Tax=Boeremia exigua TaxID=749465 RepID=UPI001E8E0839|nr:uncharacterized protein C7974DRAFT_452559 [Boeremia exigua]KAH6633282.1 hypothetical protein C7974DRAFT_452559 [Boeremia exigua]
MAILNATELEVWRGPFSWDGLFLRVHIKTVKTDYDAEDPLTWPLIKDVVQTEANYDYRQTKSVPRFLAYEQSLMENLVTQRPFAGKVSCRPNIPGHQIKAMFADYPYNFDKYGALREYPHIPVEELHEWVKLMRGLTPDAKYYPARPPQSTLSSSYQVDAQTDSAVAHELFNKDHASNTTTQPPPFTRPQPDLSTTHNQLHPTTPATLQARTSSHTKPLHAVTQKVRALELLLNDQHLEAEERANAAENRIGLLEQLVEGKKKGLETAEEELGKIEEAILRVWGS